MGGSSSCLLHERPPYLCMTKHGGYCTKKRSSYNGAPPKSGTQAGLPAAHGPGAGPLLTGDWQLDPLSVNLRCTNGQNLRGVAADFLTPDGVGSCRKCRNFGAHRSLVQSCGCGLAAPGLSVVQGLWFKVFVPCTAPAASRPEPPGFGAASVPCCCGAGRSQSPVIAASALAVAFRENPEDCLRRVVSQHPSDVSPGFWDEVKVVLDRKAR